MRPIPKIRQNLPATALPRVMFVMIVFLAQLNPVLAPPPAPSMGVLQTIGDFLSLGANTVRELQEAIKLASGEVKEILEQLVADIEKISQMLETKFQNNLNFALSSLDNATFTILLQLESQIATVNELIQDDIRLVKQGALDIIKAAGLEIRRDVNALEQSIQRSIFIIGITGAFLIDKAANNIVLIISVIMLGLGLLVFIWLLFTRRIPSGVSRNLVFIFIALYLALFGSMIVPPVRALAMAFSGVGLEQRLQEVAGGPRVIDAFPDTITLGETKEVDVWGSLLRQEGKQLSVTIAGVAVPVKAAVDERVVVDVANLAVPEGSTTLTLLYDGQEGPGAIVTIVSPEPPQDPAELIIERVQFTPSSPVQNANTQALIRVCNRGSSLASSFVVQWKPTGNAAPLSFRVSKAEVNECPEALYNFAYPGSGTFDTVVIVDAFNDVEETNEGNNSQTLRITVRPEDNAPPPPPPPTLPPDPPACPSNRPKCCEPGPDNSCFLCVPKNASCP